jgi:D-3-phosphoglycerate dehydrogenase / 2-oxoglutarate reductase
MKVLISDNVAPEAIQILESTGKIEVHNRAGLSPQNLLEIISEYDGLIIRSATKVTKEVIEAGTRLKVIGRAGSGLDNVDVPAATKRGIVVMNTPDGNTITTAEHTISMILALSRNIPQATASMKANKWEKKKFEGREVYWKTLGVIGMGKIGKVVADRAMGLKMKVIAHDPYLKEEIARDMGVELVSLDELYARSDYVTVHVPKTKETMNLIDREAISKMKDGVMLINCARGGIINEEALYEALKEGKLWGAALDVFVQEPPGEHPLLGLPNLICTPHLGASTEEAQRKVAEDVARQFVDYLLHDTVKNAVNLPSIDGELVSVLRPYLDLSEKMGRFMAHFVEGAPEEVSISYQGEVSQLDCRPLTISVLVGLLSPVVPDGINFINAPHLAKERGIKVTEAKIESAEDFVNLISITLKTNKKEAHIAGTLFGKREPRIVRLDSFTMEATPEGHLVFIKSGDSPGVIGGIGSFLGQHGININRMSVGQDLTNKLNIILLHTDITVSGPVMEGLGKLPHIIQALRFDI